SMRSQLLICLEQFHGVVVFATNFVQAYDKAFETRVRHIEFPMPDINGRRDIWRRHLVNTLPQGRDVDPQWLAENFDDLCGRDIKNAVIDATVRMARDMRWCLNRNDLVAAVERIKRARVPSVEPCPLTASETLQVREQIKRGLPKGTSGNGNDGDG